MGNPKELKEAVQYEDWFTSTCALLKRKECYRAVADTVNELLRLSQEEKFEDASEGVEDTPDDQGEKPVIVVGKSGRKVAQDKIDKAFGIIYDTLHEDLYPVVRHCHDPNDLLRAIHDHFYLESGYNLVALCTEIWELKLYEGAPASGLFDSINTLSKAIAMQGGNVSDPEKAAIALKALPESYKELRALINAQFALAKRKDKSAQLQYKDIKDSVLLFETSLRDREPLHDTVLMGREIKCGRCQRPGHNANDCRAPAPVKPGDSNNGPLKARACWKCGNPGHLKNACPDRGLGVFPAL